MARYYSSWSSQTGGYSMAMQVFNDRLYVGTDQGEVFQFMAEVGGMLFRFPSSGVWAIAEFKGDLYVVSGSKSGGPQTAVLGNRSLDLLQQSIVEDLETRQTLTSVPWRSLMITSTLELVRTTAMEFNSGDRTMARTGEVSRTPTRAGAYDSPLSRPRPYSEGLQRLPLRRPISWSRALPN